MASPRYQRQRCSAAHDESVMCSVDSASSAASTIAPAATVSSRLKAVPRSVPAQTTAMSILRRIASPIRRWAAAPRLVSAAAIANGASDTAARAPRAVRRHNDGGLAFERQARELGRRVAVVEAGRRARLDLPAEQREVVACELSRLLDVLADDGAEQAVLVHGDDRCRRAQHIDDRDGVAPRIAQELRREGDGDLHASSVAGGACGVDGRASTWAQFVGSSCLVLSRRSAGGVNRRAAIGRPHV